LVRPQGTANNELEGYDNVAFSYDDNGNTTRKSIGTQEFNYAYDVEDRLVRAEDGLGAEIATYYYDPFGRRLYKEVDGTQTYFVYSNEGLIGEYDETGAEIKTYGWVPDSQWSTDPLFYKQQGQYYWYQNDHLGTPQKIIETSGRVVWSAVYDSFGNVQIQTEEIVNNLRFAGQYYDQETGLYYNLNRYYDPSTGRYLRTDPFGNGLNLYTYVYNNPNSLIDPLGLCALNFSTGLFSSSVNLLANASFQIAIEGAGLVANIAEVIQSMIQNPYDTPVSLKEAMFGIWTSSMLATAEIAENAAYTAEVVFRTAEEVFNVSPDKKTTADYFKKYRLQYSQWSSDFKNDLQDFIAGGKRKDTFITATRREISDIGTMNKSLLSEQMAEVVSNFSQLIRRTKN
jgi:RHS repeat-associated protein